jgi:hypothetical protein
VIGTSRGFVVLKVVDRQEIAWPPPPARKPQ